MNGTAVRGTVCQDSRAPPIAYDSVRPISSRAPPGEDHHATFSDLSHRRCHGCLLPAAAEQEKTSSPVPAEFQSLISKDAKCVFFMKNPARVMNEAKSLGIVKELPPTTLSKGMELPFTSEKPIQADQFFIGWSNEFPQLFEEPVMHLATRIPADQVNKLKPRRTFPSNTWATSRSSRLRRIRPGKSRKRPATRC